MRTTGDRKRAMVDDEMIVKGCLHRGFAYSRTPALSLRNIAPLWIYIQNSL